MNLAEELERAIGEGPTSRPLSQRLAAGRKALRRRTVVHVVATVCVVAVGGAILSTTIGDVATSGSVASDTRSSDTRSSDLDGAIPPQDRRLEPTLSRQAPVGLDLSGNLVVLEGVLVTRTIQNPLNLTPPGYSMGVEFQFERETSWQLLHVDATSEGAVFLEGPPRDQTFEEWVSEASGWAAKDRGSVGR